MSFFENLGLGESEVKYKREIYLCISLLHLLIITINSTVLNASCRLITTLILSSPIIDEKTKGQKMSIGFP